MPHYALARTATALTAYAIQSSNSIEASFVSLDDAEDLVGNTPPQCVMTARQAKGRPDMRESELPWLR